MLTFRRKPAPTDPAKLPAHIDQLEQRIEESARRGSGAAYYEVLYEEPSKLTAGMVVYADGSSFNPGSGEGLYRYSLAGSWVHLG